MVGVGRRALRVRRCRFARERREAVFWGVGGGVEWRWARVVVRSVTDMVGGFGEGGCGEMMGICGLLVLAEGLLDAGERM